MPFGRRSPLETLALPGAMLAYKYSQFRQRRREAASRRVTERELSALHHKIVSFKRKTSKIIISLFSLSVCLFNIDDFEFASRTVFSLNRNYAFNFKVSTRRECASHKHSAKITHIFTLEISNS